MSTKQQIFATCIKMEKNLKFLWAGKNFSVKNKRKKRSKVFRIINRNEHAVAYVFLLL